MSLDVQVEARIGTFELQVTFDAPAGISALFGPSGAGKTQTLRAIAGLLRPRTGRIVLDGRVLFDSDTGIDVPSRARRVGYVFQQYALFPHLDVAANVGYGLHALDHKERAARVRVTLALVGLAEYGPRAVRDLSGGQQQRVALARALAPRPDLLLLDEPFSAVDALVRAQLRRELLNVQETTGVPMLLVTHDLAEVRQLASHVVVLQDGQVLQCGPLSQVFARPADERVADLLAAADA